MGNAFQIVTTRFEKLDLSAAFDCVDHGILLDRLKTSFGFSGVVFDWMQAYLVGRRQYVRYNGSTLSVTLMQSGVPQGSVHGTRPIVFRSLYCRCVSNCWRAGVLHPWIRR